MSWTFPSRAELAALEADRRATPATQERPALTPLNPDSRQYMRVGNPAKGGPGRTELWSVRSADHRWLYERQDEPGTPWFVFDTHAAHQADRFCGRATSLRGCRQMTGDPDWDTYLAASREQFRAQHPALYADNEGDQR